MVCIDETYKQLIGHMHEAIACALGRSARVDHEYVRNGVAGIFREVEPLAGKRHVEASEHRMRKDWAWWIKGMLDEHYPNAVHVRLILDNLNTHCLASLYEVFELERGWASDGTYQNPLHAQAWRLAQHG